MVDANRLNGWAPLSFVPHPRPALDWCWLADHALTDAFFEDTITRCFRNPSSLLFRRSTVLAELASVLTQKTTLPVSGFVFHISRCGSTLVSRALAALPSLRVYSEPPAVDGVLRSSATDDEVATAIRALGVKWRSAPEQAGVIVKLDCWHLAHADRLKRLFPQTPQVFLYRDPLEVLVSQLTEPGAWTVPGVLPGRLLGIQDTATRCIAREEFCARALAHFLQIGADLVGRRVILPVDYRTLPAAISERVLPEFGVSADPESRRLIEAVAAMNVKRPHEIFRPDNGRKRAAASEALVEMAAAITGCAWAALQKAIAN